MWFIKEKVTILNKLIVRKGAVSGRLLSPDTAPVILLESKLWLNQAISIVTFSFINHIHLIGFCILEHIEIVA